jgi:DnaJ-class molecular chaperone
MAPYCMECGERIGDDEEYCDHCGSLLEENPIRTKEIRCPVCRGRGEISAGGRSKGFPSFPHPCGECEGTGRLVVDY